VEEEKRMIGFSLNRLHKACVTIEPDVMKEAIAWD
jgi:hypothetical protein